MSSVLLYHPLGLGDHIVCNGLVREYAQQYDQVGLFCFERNAPSIQFLYRDVANLTLEVIRSHGDARKFIFLNRLHMTPHRYDRVQPINTFSAESGVQYERQLYRMARVPIEKLWDSFYIERDRAREQMLEAKLDVATPYQFIHDDARFPIDSRRVSSSLAEVRPKPEYTNVAFDYCGSIEYAQEVHVVDSSFMFLVDCLPYNNPSQKLFAHRYARPNFAWNLPILKKPWTILN